MNNMQLTFTQTLNLAHTAFLDELGKLEQAISPGSGEGVAALCTRLAAIHALVTEHFRFEEEGGYMDAVRKREPRLGRAIEELGQEHSLLQRSLDALRQEARAAGSLDGAFRGKVRSWIEQVRHHEARENELVQDATNQDISAGD